jgi:histone H4
MSSKAKSSKSLGKGAKSQRTVLRNNIQGISRPALQRVMRRGGIKRISGLMYEELRDVMKMYMEEIIKDMVIFVEHDRRKTVQTEDLEASLEMHGIQLAAGLNPNAKKTKSIQSCNSRGKSGPTKKSKVKAGEGDDEGVSAGEVKKPHRFRPGTRAIRAIRYQQKNSDCLAIPKANFDRLTREIAQDYYDGDLRFSEGVIELLQLVVEDYMIDLCADAYRCTLFAGRDTIQPKDIHLAWSIRRDVI